MKCQDATDTARTVQPIVASHQVRPLRSFTCGVGVTRLEAAGALGGASSVGDEASAARMMTCDGELPRADRGPSPGPLSGSRPMAERSATQNTAALA